MRRNQKRKGLVKVLTAAAVVTALSTNSISVYASSGYEWIQVGLADGTGQTQLLSLEDLGNKMYRDQVIAAFNAREPIYARRATDDAWMEISETATATHMINALDEEGKYYPYLSGDEDGFGLGGLPPVLRPYR